MYEEKPERSWKFSEYCEIINKTYFSGKTNQQRKRQTDATIKLRIDQYKKKQKKMNFISPFFGVRKWDLVKRN